MVRLGEAHPAARQRLGVRALPRRKSSDFCACYSEDSAQAKGRKGPKGQKGRRRRAQFSSYVDGENPWGLVFQTKAVESAFPAGSGVPICDSFRKMVVSRDA